MALDHLSFATTPIVALAGDEPLWQGSGFFYVANKGDSTYVFLVTNRHVLTGTTPGRNGYRQSLADHVLFQFHEKPDDPAAVKPVRMPLFTRSGNRVWLEHEEYSGADLAAIPVPGSLCEETALRCIDASTAVSGQQQLEPLAVLHAVGFPYGWHDKKHSLPVWRTGTLVSEPDVDFDGEPCLLADMAPLPGLAGAPVFTVTEYRPPAAGAAMARPVSVRRFLGVYASPSMPDGMHYPEHYCTADDTIAIAHSAGPLGRVWGARLVEELAGSVDIDRWQHEVLAKLA